VRSELQQPILFCEGLCPCKTRRLADSTIVSYTDVLQAFKEHCGRRNFAICRKGADGRHSRCKVCESEVRRSVSYPVLSYGSKRCCICKLEKPRTEFYPYTYWPDGRRDECRDCNSAKHRSDRISRMPRMVCRGCGSEKPITQFRKDCGRDGRLETCRECIRVLQKYQHCQRCGRERRGEEFELQGRTCLECRNKLASFRAQSGGRSKMTPEEEA